jgi:serine/threonine protein kinase/tetratricopeptide (TPR) repeat protein
MTTCPSTLVLQQLLDSDGAAPIDATLAAHIDSCAACQRLLDQLSDDPDLRRDKARAQRLLGKSEPEKLGPYRVDGVLGRGGMGVVLRAYDAALARPVALKVMRPELADAAARRRFLREARAAALVQHDHIVPVYAVADPPDGPPYLAMQLVVGPTLREHIKDEERLEPREAARIVREVAGALAAAHAAGLVHRDVKPGNILLDTQQGRAKVADFGLVRGAEGDHSTVEGSLRGTPEYMSPEQVRSPEQVDGRSDVYSLGVTLYEALTGEVPFRALPHLVLDRILNDEPLPPRRLNDRVPRDLETICLKAMAKEPHRRYATATDFAADLGRFLAGEPIRARPAGKVERFDRWCRRNPRVAGLSAALLLVLVGGLAAVSWQWYRAETKSVEADRQRAEAEENFRTTLKVVDEYLVRISENRLLNEPGMQPLRRDLLETARGFYQRFVEAHRGDAVFRAEQARALQRLGNITLLLDGPAQAIELYQQALAIQERQFDEHPEVAVHRYDLAYSWNNLGIACEATKEPARAEAAYRKVLELSEPETGSAFRLMMARGHINLGKVLGVQRLADAAAQYEQALAIGKQLVQAREELPDSQRSVAIAYNNLGDLQRFTGQPERGEDLLKQASAAWENLLKEHPGDIHARDEWCRTRYNLAFAWLYAGRTAESVACYEEGLPQITELAAQNPAVVKFQQDLAAWHGNLGIGYQRQQRYPAAKTHLEAALQGMDRLAEAAPRNQTYVLMAAIYHGNLGNLLRELGEQGMEQYDRALAVAGTLLTSKPADPVYTPRAVRRWVHQQRAIAQAEQDRLAEAAADWQRAREMDGGSFTHLLAVLDAAAQARATGADPVPLVRDHYAAAPKELAVYESVVFAFGSELYAFARMWALASRAAAADDRLAAVERSKRSADFAARAVAYLQRAEADGYFRLPARRARLGSDPDFDALRERDDFRDLCKRVIVK